MRWTHIAGRNPCATSGVCADGEVVWFWRPDAGAKSVVRPTDDGGKRARSPGRARRKPLKPLRRECRLIAVYLWLLTPVLFLLHRRPWVLRASGIPCAL